MKKLVLLIAIIILCSCEKDDTGNVIPAPAKVLGEWEPYKIERQVLILDWNAGDLVQSIGWSDVTPSSMNVSMKFNEDFSFNVFYDTVITSGGIWSKTNDDNFSLTFNTNPFSDLQENYKINFYCDNTMSIQYLLEAPAGDHDFQNDDWYIIQYYRLPETLACDDLINYNVTD